MKIRNKQAKIYPISGCKTDCYEKIALERSFLLKQTQLLMNARKKGR